MKDVPTVPAQCWCASWPTLAFQSLICNLLFAENIDLMGGGSGKLQDLTNRLVDRATACGKEVSAEKRKIMTNSTNNLSAYISMNGQKLEEV